MRTKKEIIKMFKGIFLNSDVSINKHEYNHTKSYYYQPSALIDIRVVICNNGIDFYSKNYLILEVLDEDWKQLKLEFDDIFNYKREKKRQIRIKESIKYLSDIYNKLGK
ncbi:MAG: hypothetical protein GTN36_05530 [Candidatus Aenigmarchaeota archaeon]|nr:hypothetical protein [Candidatus Aenigmarchaeota archaeon]